MELAGHCLIPALKGQYGLKCAGHEGLQSVPDNSGLVLTLAGTDNYTSPLAREISFKVGIDPFMLVVMVSDVDGLKHIILVLLIEERIRGVQGEKYVAGTRCISGFELSRRRQ